ncbi:prostaglandin E2 receptor EP2 subtype-like [Brienomyrus brachyistius]|uniref:prostaglandin E2 receptor EP2 subtype-like n=1 Tax=Brienomyrus brachyistius TaxID=42636 RepID=UPI0020B36688|nr:prostaglandin E2 receptor EP2 subtype-like [Brienomyrus brachyistius]
MAEKKGICPDTNHTMSGNPTVAGLMFSIGVVGNLIAFLLLEVHRRREQVRQRRSLFHILVTVLVVTDLLGTISVSPLVLASYATNVSLVGMNKDKYVCTYFGFSMTFLSLSTLAILFTMALERWISIGHPYFYERHVTKRYGYISVAFIFIVSICFSVLPLINFGEFVQYCRGTWCFIHMQHEMIQHKVYAILYATIMLLMISSTVLCNVSVICHLVLMYRRRKLHQGSVAKRSRRFKRSMSEEVEHMILLVFMTVAFVICSVPLMIRVCIRTASNYEGGSENDLRALHLLSVNPIIDPLVYIILNPSVLRFLRRNLCKQAQRSRHGVDEDVGTPSRLSNHSSSVELSKFQIIQWVN